GERAPGPPLHPQKTLKWLNFCELRGQGDGCQRRVNCGGRRTAQFFDPISYRRSGNDASRNDPPSIQMFRDICAPFGFTRLPPHRTISHSADNGGGRGEERSVATRNAFPLSTVHLRWNMLYGENNANQAQDCCDRRRSGGGHLERG